MESANYKVAAIDIGTNSAKLAVGHFDENGVPQFLRETAANVRLGEGTGSSKEISPEALERTISAIAKFKTSIESLGVDKTRVVGTSALREARNRADFAKRIHDEFGFDLEILSERDECKYAYLSVTKDPVLGKFDGEQVMVDIGGGSTEFAFGNSEKIRSMSSVKVGAVRLTEAFLNVDQPTSHQIDDAQAYADEILSSVHPKPLSRVVGVGGSILNLTRIWGEVPLEKNDEAHGALLDSNNVRQLIEGMCALSLEKRRTLVGLEPDRADIIIGGAVILESVLRLLEKDSLITSTRGLRHGIVYEMLEEV